MRTIDLRFGALAPSLAEQLTGAGVPHENLPSDLHYHQRDADAISRLVVRGRLTAAEARRARQRLFKALVRDLEAGAHHSKEPTDEH